MERSTALTLIGTLLGLSLFVGAEHGSAARTAEIMIESTDPDQRGMAEWAVGRFEEAGLVLPDLTIRFPGRDQALCGGARGRAFTDRRPVVIDMCWNDSFILLHELAHVWEASTVPENRRAAFMAMRTSVVAWTGRDVPWEQQGREHAANVIAWGLLEDPFAVSRTYPNDRDSLTAAFTFLAGTEPLHDGGPDPYRPDRSLYEGRSNPRLEAGR